jgi:hypothetical protein
MARVLQEPGPYGGIYPLDRVGGLQAAPIKGDRNDQQKVTHVNTIILFTAGGVVHTVIPWEEAKKVALEEWDGKSAPQQTEG